MMLSSLKCAADVVRTVPDEESALNLLVAEGFISLDRICKRCKSPMALRKRGRTFEFRCRLTRGKDCSSEGLRKGSWFEKSRIPLKDCIMLITLWINEYSSKQIVKEASLSPSTVVDFRNYLRNACTEISATYAVLGGPGKKVQIDESAIHARKYGRGTKDRELTWVLGAIEEGSRNCRMQIVPNRTKKTLVPILRTWIDRQTEVHTDSWGSYSQLSKYFSSHKKVNHSEEFKKIMEDGTVVHTNTVESLWKRLKDPIKKGNGTSEALLPSYIDECVVREKEGVEFAACIWGYIKSFGG